MRTRVGLGHERREQESRRSAFAAPAMLLLALFGAVACGGSSGGGDSRVGVPDAIASTVALSAETGLADGTTPVTVTVTVRDVFGTNLAGHTVVFSLAGSGNILDQPLALTDADGRTTGTLAATTPGVKRLRVTINPGTINVVTIDAPDLTFLADVDANVSQVLTTPLGERIANGIDAQTVRVRLFDGRGTPLSGQKVRIAATGQSVTVSQASQFSAANGEVTAQVTTPVPQTVQALVFVNEGAPNERFLLDQPTIIFAQSVGDGSVPGVLGSTAEVSKSVRLADGLDEATLTATIRDAQGDALVGQTVELAVVSDNPDLRSEHEVEGPGSGIILSGTTAQTDPAGRATFTVRSTRVQTLTFTLTANPGETGELVLADHPTIEFVPAIDPARVVVSAVPQDRVVADGRSSSRVKVRLIAVDGSPAEDVPVAAAAAHLGVLLPRTILETDASGEVTFFFSSTLEGTGEVSLRIYPGTEQEQTLADAPRVTFVANTISQATFVEVGLTGQGPVSDPDAARKLLVDIPQGSTRSWIILDTLGLGGVPAGDSYELRIGTPSDSDDPTVDDTNADAYHRLATANGPAEVQVVPNHLNFPFSTYASETTIASVRRATATTEYEAVTLLSFSEPATADRLEPNDDLDTLTPLAFEPVGIGTATRVVVENLSIVDGGGEDVDAFVFQVVAGQEVKIEVATRDGATAILDVGLFDLQTFDEIEQFFSTSSAIGSGAFSGTTVHNLTPGFYVVYVYSRSGTAAQPYLLRMSLSAESSDEPSPFDGFQEE